MTNISVVSKQSHQVLENVNSKHVGLSENSVVVVQVSKEDVASITRENNNALINLRNGEVIVIENYFNPEFSDNSLVFEEQDGLLYWVKFTNVDGTIADTIQYYPIDEIEPLLYSDNFLGGILPWLIGAGAAGAIAAAAKDDDKDPPVPDNKPATLTTPALEDDVDPIKGPIKNGDSTNDAKPTISGSGATPGATIKVYDGNKVIAETVADSEGKWSVTPAENLADGQHNVSVTQTVDGKESDKSPVVDFKVDTIPPQKPNIDDFTNDKGETNDSKPTIKGDGEPNSNVIIDVKDKDGNVIDSKTVPVNDKGKWEYKPDNKLDDGKHDIIVTPIDGAGNKGDSNTKPFIVDTVPPIITIEKPTDTDDSTPTIKGKTESGASVTVQIVDENGNVKASGPATVASNGDWTFTPANPLPEGKYKVKAEAQDSAGNKANAETEGLFAIDSGDLSVRVNDVVDGKEVSPEITGTVKAGAAVTVYIISKKDGEIYESGTATVNGTSWTFKPSKALVDGDYEVYAEAKQLNTTEKSNTDSFVVDTTGPAISIDEPANTDDQTPTITGTTDKDDAVVVKVRILDSTGKVVASGNADLTSDGKWSFTPETSLPDGKYTVEADALDKFDNKGSAKSKSDFVIDTIDPSKLVSVDPLGKTKDNTPDITGETAVGSTVKVIILKNGVEVATGDAVVTGGTWKYTPTIALADDSYEVKAIATYNNKIGTSNTVPLIVDTTPPNLDIDDPDDNDNPDPFGTNNTLRTLIEPENTLMADTLPPIYVKDPRFTFSGNRDDSETVKIIISRFEDGEEVEIFNRFATIKGEKWEYKPPINLPEGTFKITVLGNDDVNNVGSYSRDLIVDLTPPPIEVGSIPLTKDNTPTFTGKTETGLKSFQLQVRDANGKPVETVTKVAVDASGNWNYTPSKELPDGKYTLELVADDLAGNRTRKTTEVTIDTIAPQIEIDEPQNTADTTPTITGRTEVGATVKVQILDKDGKVAAEGPATVAPNGDWSFTPATPLADGKYKVYAEATDAAGNVGNDTSANTFDINDKAPEVSINDIDDTNDTTPDISGKTDAGSTVVVTITDKDGKVVATGPATVTGDTWTYTASPALAKDGDYIVKAEATSPTGVKGQAEPKEFTLDTTPPVITIEEPKDTSDNTPEIKGKTEPGATVNVQILDKDGKVVAEGPATVAPNGDWTYTPDKELPNGEYKVKAEAKDPVGNVGKAETAGSFDIDNTDPSKFVTVDPIADTNDTTPDVTGKTLEGSTVTVTVKDKDGNVVATGPATVNGTTWTYTVSPALAKDGDYTVQAEATSKTGVKGKSNEETFELDTTPPIITINEPVDTEDTTPEITGKTEPGATVNVQVLDKDGKVVAEGPATVAPNGDWTFTPKTELPEGEYKVKAEAKDPVGNVGKAESAGSFNVDTKDPADYLTINDIKDGNDTTPDVAGKTLEGSTVTVKIKDAAGVVVQEGAATVTGDTWTYNVSPALAKDGNYTAEATATYKNKSATKSDAFLLDTTPPVVEIDTLAKTRDTTPDITGTSEAGAKVIVQVLTPQYELLAKGEVTTDANGKWKFTPITPLPEGTLWIVAEASDQYGNAADAIPKSFVIDLTPPSPTIDDPEDDNDDPFNTTIDGGEELELFAAGIEEQVVSAYATTTTLGAKTLSNEPVVTAAAVKPIYFKSQTFKVNGTTDNDTIKGDVKITNAAGVVVASGPATLVPHPSKPGYLRWEFTVSSPLPEGEYNLSITSTDATGLTGTTSNPIVIDITPPVLTIDTEDLTNVKTPVISGTSEPNGTVALQIKDANGTVVVPAVTVPVDANGKWSYTPSTPLVDGKYTIDAVAKDAAGHTTRAQDSITIDTTPPAAPTGQLSNNNTVIAGEAEPGSKVKLTVDGKVVGETTADANGKYTYTFDKPITSPAGVVITATDAANNTSLPGYAKITAVVLDAKNDFNTIVHADEASNAITYRNGSTSKLNLALAKASIFKLDQDTDVKTNSDTNNSGADAAILKYQGDDIVFKVADNTAADITFKIDGWTGVGLTGVGDTLNVVGEALNFILNAPKNLFNWITGKPTTTATVETGNIYALLIKAGTNEIVDKVQIGKNVPLLITSIQTGSGTFKNIPAGEYEVKIVKGSSQGFIEQILKVANLDVLPVSKLTVTDAVVKDLNAPNTISGNVITGESAKDGADGIGDLSKLRIAKVQSDSVEPSKRVTKFVGTDINKDFVEVEGAHGFLIIKADGSYEYRLKEGVTKAVVGQTDVFTYTVLNGDKDASAKLTIKIDDKNLTISRGEQIPEDSNIQAIKDYNLLESKPTAIHDNLNNTFGNFGFAGSAKILDNLKLGNGKGTLAELNIITPENSLQFEVQDGHVQDLTLSITGGGLSFSSVVSTITQLLGFQSSVRIDVQDKITGKIINVGTYEAEFVRGVDNVLLYRVNGNKPIEIKGLQEGSYEIIPTVVPADPLSQGIEVLAKLEFFKNLKLTVTDSVAYELPEVKGNVIEGGEYYNGQFLGKDDIHSKVIVDKVQVFGESSSAVALTGNFATIQGKYGELTIYNNGNYSYRLTDLNTDGARVETFTYTIKNAYGKSSTAELEIKVNPDGTTYISTEGVDQVGSNSDQSTTLLFKVLDYASNTGGNADNGPDVFLGFKQAYNNNDQTEPRDFIDISSLISGHGATSANLSNFVTVTSNGKDTTISIDRDGKQGFNSATFQEKDLVVLKDVNTTLDELLKSNQIIF